LVQLLSGGNKKLTFFDRFDWLSLTRCAIEQRLAPLFHHHFGPTLPPETTACQRANLTTAWQNA
jgi:hypothetical protein